jgi:hypothetical protein
MRGENDRAAEALQKYKNSPSARLLTSAEKASLDAYLEKARK